MPLRRMMEAANEVLNYGQNWTTPLALVQTRPVFTPRPGSDYQSPDLNGSLAYTRQPQVPSNTFPRPWPYIIGAVAGFMPMMDALSQSFMIGKTPSGPNVLTPPSMPPQAQFPQLPKVTG